MKIAFVDLGRHYGGIEIYILSLAKAWMENKNECIFLVRKNSTFHNKLMQLGFSDEVIPVEFDWNSIKMVRKHLIGEQVELMHVNGINSGVFAKLLNLPIKQVSTVHGNAIYDRVEKGIVIGKLFVWLENQCLKKSHMIISVSKDIKNILVKRGIDEKKVVVINNGIKEFVYMPAEKEDSDVFKICYVGRLETVKGCEYLIRALAKIENRNFRCDIYGEGSLKEELEALSKELNLTDKIFFMGFSDKVRDVLSQYDVLVQASLYEAFPLTLLEAMNAHVLVICSDVGGMREIVSDGETGLRFQVGNTDELAADIIWAMNHKEDVYLMKEKAFNKYSTEYTESVMQQKTFHIFERCCHEL